jgi:RNA polymerase sigma-70 factor (ECF subfamily)
MMSVDDRGRDQSSDLPELARHRFELGRAAWPDLGLGFEVFEPYFHRHSLAAEPPCEEHASDLYLACACGEGIEDAIAALEHTLASDVTPALASIDSSHEFVEEMLQATRERLFVGKDGRASKILEYGGRASLRSWLCAVAVRVAISNKRRKGEQRHVSFESRADERVGNSGPELDYLRRRYKSSFEDAVRSAIRSLPPRQRMLLRLNVVHGMSIDQLGTTYRVGRSTAARWLANARRALFERTRGELQTKLRLTSTEIEALAADMQSQIDVSVARLLERSADDGIVACPQPPPQINFAMDRKSASIVAPPKQAVPAIAPPSPISATIQVSRLKK